MVKSSPKEKPASLVIGNTFLHGWDCEQSKGLSFIAHLKKNGKAGQKELIKKGNWGHNPLIPQG